MTTAPEWRPGPVGNCGDADGFSKVPGTPEARPQRAPWRLTDDQDRARRALNAWCREHGLADVWMLSTPLGDPYRDAHLDLGLVEREGLGRELATAGWAP